VAACTGTVRGRNVDVCCVSDSGFTCVFA